MNAKAKRGDEIVTKVEEKSEKKLDDEKNIILTNTTTEEKLEELEDEAKTMEDAEEEEEKGEKEAETEGGAWVARGRGVVSPSGAQHSSRAAALQAAIDMGDQQGVTQIRGMYLAEGWTTNSMPEGWMAKKDERNYMFINPRGMKARGKTNAVKLLLEGEEEEDGGGW